MTIATPISASWLDDGLTTYAPTLGGIQTAYGAVAGALRIIDLGAAGVPWHGIVAFEPSVLDESSGDETYLLTIEGSAAADFSGGGGRILPSGILARSMPRTSSRSAMSMTALSIAISG